MSAKTKTTHSRAWYRAEWKRRLGTSKLSTVVLAGILGDLAHANAVLAAKVMKLEDVLAAVDRHAETLRDVVIGYRVLAARYQALAARGGERPTEFFPELAKDGLVLVKGIPHLPDCARVPRPGAKATKKPPPCTCGSVVDEAKRRAPN